MYEIRGIIAYEAGMVPWRHTAHEVHKADPSEAVQRMVDALFKEMAVNLSTKKMHSPLNLAISFAVVDNGRSMPEAGEGEKAAPFGQRRKHRKKESADDQPEVIQDELKAADQHKKEGRWDNGKGTD